MNRGSSWTSAVEGISKILKKLNTLNFFLSPELTGKAQKKTKCSQGYMEQPSIHRQNLMNILKLRKKQKKETTEN